MNNNQDSSEHIPESVKVTDTLDLHGFFPEQVEDIVHAFIENAIDIGIRELRIVHGKGKSRLKWEVHQVLKNHPDVFEFQDAPSHSGGWGATLIILQE